MGCARSTRRRRYQAGLLPSTLTDAAPVRQFLMRYVERGGGIHDVARASGGGSVGVAFDRGGGSSFGESGDGGASVGGADASRLEGLRPVGCELRAAGWSLPALAVAVGVSVSSLKRSLSGVRFATAFGSDSCTPPRSRCAGWREVRLPGDPSCLRQPRTGPISPSGCCV